MPTHARRLLLSFGALLALALPAPAMAACSGDDVAPSDPGAVAATLCLLNEQRAAQHLPALTQSSPLDRAAGGYAGAMVDQRFFDHVSPGGSTLLQRIKAAGWVAASGSWTVGENIAWGSGSLGTPASIVDGWMHSAGHRANILNGSFAEIGIGIAEGAPRGGVGGEAGTYVTDFGSRGEASAAAAAPAPKKPVARCATKASARARAHVALRGVVAKRCVRR
ncbi:MAG TPA: CAP domain-containing protein [Baekduia sp.]|nr:CAP domain-containing protein [Baekduia sp.]